MNTIDKEKLINWLKEKKEIAKTKIPSHLKTNGEMLTFLAGADTCLANLIEQIESGKFDTEE